jgi:hypothetical protein
MWENKEREGFALLSLWVRENDLKANVSGGGCGRHAFARKDNII